MTPAPVLLGLLLGFSACTKEPHAASVVAPEPAIVDPDDLWAEWLQALNDEDMGIVRTTLQRELSGWRLAADRPPEKLRHERVEQYFGLATAFAPEIAAHKLRALEKGEFRVISTRRVPLHMPLGLRDGSRLVRGVFLRDKCVWFRADVQHDRDLVAALIDLEKLSRDPAVIEHHQRANARK